MISENWTHMVVGVVLIVVVHIAIRAIEVVVPRVVVVVLVLRTTPIVLRKCHQFCLY